MRRIIVVMLLAACGGADGDHRWAGSTETLPNGALRVTNPPEGLWDGSEPWRLVPDVVIGAIDGHEAEVFGAISGLEADDSGQIYVLDRQTNELRIFAPDGSHVRSVGRSGGGPGEYTNANGLRWVAPDTLVIVDQRGNRYSVITKEGEFVRSVPRSLGFYGWAFTGGYDNGTLYEYSVVGRADDARPALFGTTLGGLDQEQRVTPVQEAREAPSRELEVDTVYLPRTTGPLWESFSVRSERGGMSMAVPFAPKPVYHLDGRGSIWHGHGAEFVINKSSFAGDTTMQIVLNVDATPVAQEEIDEWLSQPFLDRFRDMGGKLDMNRIPGTKPFFDDLHLDPEGYLWVAIPAGPGEIAFAVVNQEGRYLGRLEAEGINRETFVPPVVRNERLYLIGRDELDVQRVYVFRIEK